MNPHTLLVKKMCLGLRNMEETRMNVIQILNWEALTFRRFIPLHDEYLA